MADANIIVKLVDQTQQGLTSVDRNLEKIEKRSGAVSSGFKKMAVAAGGFVAAIGVKGIFNYIDSIQNLENRLRLVTESQEELNQRFTRLVQLANDTRAPLTGTIDLYSKLALSAKTVGLNTGEILQVTENFNKALAISGTTGQAAEAAILQFSQALASGRFQGDEFRSITEQVPILLDLMAEKLGITRGELREYASEGLLNAELVSRLLIAATEELDEKFGSTSTTVGQAATIFVNQFNLLSKAFLDGSNAGGIIADVILFLADNMEALAISVSVLAGVALVKLLALLGPVGLAITGIATAIGFALPALRRLYDAFDFTAILLAAERSFIQFKIGSMKVIESFVNGAISSLGTFTDRTVATFSGIGAAVMDPLNAFEAFDKAFDESIAGSLEEGTEKFIDFSDSIAEGEADLEDLEAQIEQNRKANARLTDSTEDAADAQDDQSDSTDDLSDSIDRNSGEMDENSDNAKRLAELMDQLGKQTDETSNAYETFITKLERSAELAALDSLERQIQINLYEGLEARAKDLGVAVEDLSDEERQQTETRIRQLVELENSNRTRLQNEEEFTRRTNQLIEDHYRETTDAIQQIEDSKQEYLRQARALGLENEVETQNAILEFDRQITAERNRLAEEALKERQERSKKYIDIANRQLEEERNSYEQYTYRIQDLQKALDEGIILSERERAAVLRDINQEYIDGVTQEYDDLYGFFNDKLMEFTGLSRKEFGILEEVVQLTFGVNITDVIKGTFASGIQSILGFKNQGNNQLVGFGGQVGNTMGGIGNNISGTFLQTGLSAIGTFASNALGSLGGLASGIFSLFGGVGDFLGSTFGGAFRSISGAISNLFSSGGGGMGGIFSSIGSFFGPVGGIVGGIVDFFFADGGRIAPGGIGIVGEAGPEIISGPAMVTGTSETASILGNAGKTVNVNFTINAVDAEGLDEVLVSRRDLITTIVRNAVEEQGGVLV